MQEEPENRGETVKGCGDRGDMQKGRQRHSLAGQGAVQVGGDVLGVQEAAGQVQGAAGAWTAHITSLLTVRASAEALLSVQGAAYVPLNSYWEFCPRTTRRTLRSG